MYQWPLQQCRCWTYIITGLLLLHFVDLPGIPCATFPCRCSLGPLSEYRTRTQGDGDVIDRKGMHNQTIGEGRAFIRQDTRCCLAGLKAVVLSLAFAHRIR